MRGVSTNSFNDQLWRISHGDDTHRVSPFRPDGPEPPLRCRRFAYGYALDGSEYPSYLVWPQRDGQSYTLSRLSFSLQICVDHLDRVLAGCCWEVQATRTTPSESLLSLHQVAKCLTMKLAVHLAKEVAAILRAVLTHETKKLYNDSTVHLLCSN